MVKRVVLPAAVIALFVCVQTAPAAAETGFTSNDIKLTRVVADVGATATVTAEGTIDRDLYYVVRSPTGHTEFNVRPLFDLQQSCANSLTPADAILATVTLGPPSIALDHTIAVASGQKGRYLNWTITVFGDPATIAHGICPPGYVPLAPATITSMRLAIWPGLIGFSPRLTKQGELLYYLLPFPSGHTDYKSPL